jgi:hypothetical protein
VAGDAPRARVARLGVRFVTALAFTTHPSRPALHR